MASNNSIAGPPTCFMWTPVRLHVNRFRVNRLGNRPRDPAPGGLKPVCEGGLDACVLRANSAEPLQK